MRGAPSTGTGEFGCDEILTIFFVVTLHLLRAHRLVERQVLRQCQPAASRVWCAEAAGKFGHGDYGHRLWAPT